MVRCEHCIGQLPVPVHGAVLLHTGIGVFDTRGCESAGGQPGGGLSQLKKLAHPEPGRLHTPPRRHHRLHMRLF